MRQDLNLSKNYGDDFLGGDNDIKVRRRGIINLKSNKRSQNGRMFDKYEYTYREITTDR